MATFYQSHQSLYIQSAPEKIFRALTEWPVRAQWRTGIEIDWEEEGNAFLHQKVTFRVKRPFFSYSFTFLVVGLEPPRRMYIEYKGKPLQGRGAVEINPEGFGCLVHFHWMKVEPIGVAAKLFFALGLGTRAHRVRTMETLIMLKDYLEKPSE